jgi:hypothetical protein
MIKEKNNPTPKRKAKPKEDTWYNLYKRLDSWRELDPSETFLELLSVELMKWADNEESIRIVDFCHSRGIPRLTLFKWSKKYPKLGVAYRYALDALASHREDGVLKKGWNPATVHFTMGHYDEVWREEQDRIYDQKKEIALLAKDKVDKPTTIIVQQMKPEDCPEIPMAPGMDIDDQSGSNDQAE